MRQRKSEWSEKLLDPRWQKKRLEMLSAAEWMCCKCYDSQATLHVHHLFYDGREPWEYEEGEMTVLCDVCHQGEHEWRKDAEHELLQALRKRGFFAQSIFRIVNGFNNVNIYREEDVTASVIEWVMSNGSIFERLENQYFMWLHNELERIKKESNDNQAQANP